MAQATVRERIVDTASDLFYRHGVANVGMDAVRDAAQVSLRAMYKEFASKEDLVVAVLQLRHDQWEAALATAARGHDDPVDRILTIFDYLAEWAGDPSFRGCGFINVFGEMGPSSPKVADAVRTHKRSFQEYVDGLVRDAGLSPALAEHLALLAEGVQTTAAISGSAAMAQAGRQAALTLISADQGSRR